jgi:hypothetical protein
MNGLTDNSVSTAAFAVQREDVEKVFRGVNPSKAAGPDRISGRLLKTCCRGLSGAFCGLFNHSLAQHSVPALWKSSIICPVPKHSNPTCNNDFRPVVLTSIVMKSFERRILTKLQMEVACFIDPLKLAYRKDRGVDDSVVTVLDPIRRCFYAEAFI